MLIRNYNHLKISSFFIVAILVRQFIVRRLPILIFIKYTLSFQDKYFTLCYLHRYKGQCHVFIDINTIFSSPKLTMFVLIFSLCSAYFLFIFAFSIWSFDFSSALIYSLFFSFELTRSLCYPLSDLLIISPCFT